ncbi:MAG: tetratricopeptide repeat protein [Blastocatellia bacterium]|nr:tetratricopeptide repeat protein [Blastocatellia bacterium]
MNLMSKAPIKSNKIFEKTLRIISFILIFHLTQTIIYGQTVKPTENRLKIGEMISKQLKGEEKEDFYLEAKENEYIKIVVEQKGIDVLVKVYDPEAKEIFEIDSPNGTQGEEPVELVTEKSGLYKIEVSSLEKSAPLGRYEIKIDAQRTAKAGEDKKIKALQEATRLSIKAVTLYQQGKYKESEILLKQVLETRKSMLGVNHLDTASTLNNLAISYEGQARYEEAEPLYKQVLEITKSLLGLNTRETASILGNIANLYSAQGRYEEAEPLFKQALEINRSLLGVNNPDTASSLGNLAALYLRQGRYEEAEPLFKQVLEINRLLLGASNLTTAYSLYNLATLYSAQGRYEEAEPLFKEALEIRKVLLGLNHIGVAQSLNKLASLYENQGRYSEAETLYNQSLEIIKSQLGLNHPSTASGLNNLAELYRKQGRYNEAEPLYRQALDIVKSQLGLNHPMTASSINNLALLYYSQGRYSEAESLYKQSLEITKSLLGLNHPETAHRLYNLAILYLKQGRYEGVESLFKQALEIRKAVLGSNHPDTALSVHSLALLYEKQRRYEEAETLFKQALEIRKVALGLNHPDTALTINSLASLHYKQGKYEEAETLFKQALEINISLLGSKHPHTVSIFNNIAIFYTLKKDLEKGLEYKIEADNAREEEFSRNLFTGSERHKLAYLNQTYYEFNQTLSLHLQYLPNNRKAASTALTAVLRRKGRSLDAMASSIEVLRQRASAEDKELLTNLANTKALLSTVVLKSEVKQGLDKHKKKVKELEQQVEELESKVSQKSAEYRTETQMVDVKEVSRAIPEKAALIEFISYHPYNFKKDTYEPSRYIVYILDNKGKIKWTDLGAVSEIDRLTTEFRKRLREKKNSRFLSYKLYQKVIKPVVELTENKNQLLLSPDGSLNLIPFAALLDKKGNYLIEKYKLSYLTSGRDLLRLQNKVKSHQAPIIFADPDYGQAEELILKGRKFTALKRLPATAEEGRSVKKMFNQAELRMDKQATEESIKQVSGPEILHIATHGYFMEDTKRENSKETRLLVQQDNKDLDINLEKEKNENPLLRSYLFFAGANEGGSNQSDGTLTALEAANLDLRGTKLVVLSACDTGVGEVKNGEGVYGLRRALVLAGSESQMISLWQVSDKATKELMVNYYKRLKVGEGRSDALQKAQLQMLRSKKHKNPYYWASFIQSGQWSSLEGK